MIMTAFVLRARLAQADDYIFNHESSDGLYTLDVLANDRGGANMSIVSVEGLPSGVSYSIVDNDIVLNIGDLRPDEVKDFTFSYIMANGGARSGAEVHVAVVSDENLIVNGGFEQTTADPVDGSVEASPWLISGFGRVHQLPGFLSDGNFADLANPGSRPSTISQDVATTADREYKLSFDIFGVSADVIWDGQALDTVRPPSGAWRHYEYLVTGDGADSVTFSTAVSGSFNLDNVSLVPVLA
jgi:hypothetical protein